MIITISEPTRPDKKWMAKAEGHRTVHFGPRGASDYTLHHDDARRKPTSPDTVAGRTGAGPAP